jgi:F0F1-type ATP synthase membrane subunit b/b'
MHEARKKARQLLEETKRKVGPESELIMAQGKKLIEKN